MSDFAQAEKNGLLWQFTFKDIFDKEYKSDIFTRTN